MGDKLAIDFGTTNTVIARWNAHHAAPEVVMLPGLGVQVGDDAPSHIPSLVYVRNGAAGTIAAGQIIRLEGLDQQPGNRLFSNFKRSVARSSVPAGREIDGTTWTDRDAGQRFVQTLIAALSIGHTEIEHLVLTAPVASFDSYLAWLDGIMGELDPDQVCVVDESTAAALGYGASEPGALGLVFDFGGGTLDLSLVQLPESREKTGGLLAALRESRTGDRTARVIAKAGRVLGGSDVDGWLLDYILKRCHLSNEALGEGHTALLTKCEGVKIALSSTEVVALDFAVGASHYGLDLTRGDLETLLEANGFYAALGHVIEHVLHTARRSGIYKEDITHVLLVGGMSLMPSVQRMLRDIFPAVAVRADKPFTAVAEGALQVAAGTGLRDYLVHSYGMRILDRETGQCRYEEIIPAGSPLPLLKPVEIILGAAHDQQETVELAFGVIEAESVSDIQVRYEEGQAVFIAQTASHSQQVIPLGEMVQIALKPNGKRGADRIKASFTVDDQRHLHVTILDLRTKREILHDAVIAASTGQPVANPEVNDANLLSRLTITGSEPCLPYRTDRRPGQRQLSLRGLATMLTALPPGAVSPDAARAMLHSNSFYVRLHAGQLLARRGDRTARLVLQDVLESGSGPSRASAARHLYGFSWLAVEPLVAKALADADSHVREGAIYALCDMRISQAYRQIAAALQNDADNVRAAAAWGLRDCQDPDAVPALEAVLLATDFGVRVKGLEALGCNGTAQAKRVILDSLRTDLDRDVIYAATLSLLEVARESGLDELAMIMGARHGIPLEAILQAFFHAANYLKLDLIGSPALPALFETLKTAVQDDWQQARLAAIWPLAWIHHPRAGALLRDAYHAEPDTSLKAKIAFIATSLMSDVADELVGHAAPASGAATSGQHAGVVA